MYLFAEPRRDEEAMPRSTVRVGSSPALFWPLLGHPSFLGLRPRRAYVRCAAAAPTLSGATMQLRLFASLCLSLAVIACSSPKEGDSCGPHDIGACASSTSALWCEDGALLLYQCRGPGGCKEGENNEVSCSFDYLKAGDNCPRGIDFGTWCGHDFDDYNTVLKCENGTAQSQPCRGCSIESGQVNCLP